MVPILVAELGDGDDGLTIDVPSVEPLPGLPPQQELLDGSTVLRGGPGNDVLVGGGEVDEFDGGPGANRIDGGDAQDTITYADRTHGVTVDVGA